MENKYDVAAMGELLIDFTEAGVGKSGMKLFEQNPGGAPANLLTAVSHMGYKTAFIGKVGSDMHGDFLKQTLEKEGICTDYLLRDADVFTTLAFVEINEDGERNFSFSRKPGADTCISTDELDERLLQSCRIFHIGSLSLTDEPARTATFDAVKLAKASGALISFNPNYRSPLWKNEPEAVKMIRQMLPYADMVKVSDEESVLITGEQDHQKAAEQILDMGPSIIAVTLGSAGVFIADKNHAEAVSGFQVKCVDTTGAGDSFWGGFLSQFLACGGEIPEMQWNDWRKCAELGNKVAGLCVQKRGGIPAIPKRSDVLADGRI